MPAHSTLAIVGGGLSGTLVVQNLLRTCTRPLHVRWFDSEGRFCKGLAYSTPHDYHLLNVRAAGMSLYPDEPSHFVNWLRTQGLSFGASDFVPRHLFARYAQHELQHGLEVNPHVRVDQLQEEVIAAERSAGEFTIQTSSGTYSANRLLLAFGNFPPAFPTSPDQSYRHQGNYLHQCFDETRLQQLLNNTSIVILGSGLTMIDVVLSLYYNDFKGAITILSPHGYLPQAHVQAQGALPATPPGPGLGLKALLAWVNAALRKATSEGLEPLSVIDQLRPFTQAYWLGFTDAEKQQFLRHLRHKWGVARHRAPAASLEILNGLLASGRARILKGRIRHITETADGLKLSYQDAHGQMQGIETGGLINCTGPGSDYSRLDQPLVKKLLAQGLIAPDAIRYGLQAAPDGRIGEGLYTLGPPLKGILWESTAIPEIRLQARDLALKIIHD